MVVPSRRSTAEAFQLLAAHAIGEAGAPYLVGLMADAFEVRLAILSIFELSHEHFKFDKKCLRQESHDSNH